MAEDYFARRGIPLILIDRGEEEEEEKEEKEEDSVESRVVGRAILISGLEICLEGNCGYSCTRGIMG